MSLTDAERDSLLAVLMDEYGGEAEEWTSLRSLTRVGVTVEAIATARIEAFRAAAVAAIEAEAREASTWTPVGNVTPADALRCGQNCAARIVRDLTPTDSARRHQP